MPHSFRVLVTGGAGYIGSHACAALSERGIEPIVYDNFSTGNEWAVRFGPFVRGDVLDTTKVVEAIHRFRPAAVIHFAALSQVGESLHRATEYYAVNVGGILSVLSAMRQTELKAIVFSSSAAVYGDAGRSQILEDHPLRPSSPYGATKLQAETVLRELGRLTDLRYVILRYFNAAGAHPESIIGEAHEPETHLIPSFLRSLLAGDSRRPQIHGADYDTPDGTCIRDYIHVSDLADAHLRAIDYLLAGGANVSVNVGLGRGHSVLEVASAVEAVTGSRLELINSPRRIGDPPILVADPGVSRSLLDFAPRFTHLEDIVTSAWNWHLRYHGGNGA